MTNTEIQDSIQAIALRIRSNQLRQLENRIQDFMFRTRLPSTEITIVHFRGKELPQWAGCFGRPTDEHD